MITPPASRPVPLEVLQTPYFKSLLHTCLHLHHCHTFPVSQLLSELNSLIEDVALHTKDFLHANYDLNTWDSLQKLVTSDQHVLFMKHQRLNIGSRRFWQNNWQLAQKLLANQHVLNDLIVVSNKSVKLKYPNTFSIKFEETKHVAIKQLMAVVHKAIQTAADPNTVQAKSRSTLVKLSRVSKKMVTCR